MKSGFGPHDNSAVGGQPELRVAVGLDAKVTLPRAITEELVFLLKLSVVWTKVVKRVLITYSEVFSSVWLEVSGAALLDLDAIGVVVCVVIKVPVFFDNTAVL